MKKFTALEETVLAYYSMMEERQSSAELERFYHPDVQQIEYPNALNNQVTLRDLDALKEGAEKGNRILEKEEYEVVNLYTIGNTVISEAIWRGTLSIPLGSLAAGSQIIAYFAQVFEFKEGKIVRQRNYDCFEF